MCDLLWSVGTTAGPSRADQFADRRAAVGDRAGTIDGVHELGRRGDAEQVEDRRGEVAGTQRPGVGITADAVAGAHDLAARNADPGQGHGETGAPMIPSALGIDLG